MKTLVFGIVLLMGTSCSVLQSAKDALKSYGDYREYKGAEQVREALKKNKEEINKLKVEVGKDLLELGLTDTADVDVAKIMPPMVALAQLLLQRNDLKKQLADAISSESAADE